MNNIEYWIIFGLLVSIIASTYDMPLRLSKLFFSLLLGIVGSLVGGVFAYFIYGMEISGINISLVFIAVTGSIALLFFKGSIEKFYNSMKGGDKHAGWNV